MSVLILVIYNPSPLYDAQRDFWRRMNIPAYFITLDNVPEITLDGDTLRIPGIETYENILLKTLIAIDYFTNRNSYDFVIRTNISSIWDYPQLLTKLSTLPKTNLYCGLPGGVRGDMSYVSGSGMILTPDVCKKLIDSKDVLLGFGNIDDVDIGLMCYQLSIPVTVEKRHDIYDDTLEIPSGFYHYRVRLLPPPPDVINRTIACMERVKCLMPSS
jgi:hypothetical protein